MIFAWRQRIYRTGWPILLALSFLIWIAAQPGRAETLPEPDVGVFVDPTAQLSLQDILSGGDAIAFEPAPDQMIKPRYSRDAVWMRVRLTSPTAMNVLMSLTPNYVDFIDVYVADERPSLTAADFSHLAYGAKRPLNRSGYSSLDEVVPLELAAGRTKIAYIRAAAPDIMLMLNMQVFQPVEHAIWRSFVNAGAGLWFGSMCLLLITQLILYRFDRDPLYLLLAMMVMGAVTYHASSLGYTRVLLFPGGGDGNDIFFGAFSSFGVLSGGLVALKAFDFQNRRNWMYWLAILTIFIAAVGMVGPFFGLNLYTAPLRNVATQASVLGAAIYSLMTLRRSDRSTYLRAAAFCVLAVGLTTMMLYYWNLGLPRWAAHGYAIACLGEAVLLTAMLVWRLRATTIRNRNLREEALAAARDAERRAMAIVAERTGELVIAKQTAEAALAAEMAQQRSQVRFMEIISHQYRTPLASIRSNIDTIELSLAPEDEANRNRVWRIRRAIVRLIEVLEFNLERSRIQGSALDPIFEDVEIVALFSDVERRAGELMPDAEINVSIAPDAARALIRADHHMMELALINLVENAVKYSAPVGGPPVVLKAAVEGDAVMLCVEDRGIGIPEDEIETILRDNVRGSNVQGISGTGNGLSLVSRLVAAHNGRLSIDSRVGQGTTVTVSIAASENIFSK